MNPLLFCFLVAVGVGLALCALLAIAGGLIHTSLKRRKATSGGGWAFRSRILYDLKPVEDLLVEFVRHSQELTTVLAILSAFAGPKPFARLVHEVRIRRNGPTDLGIAANLVVPILFIMVSAELIRGITGGFIITEVGRELLRRISRASQPIDQATALAKQTIQPVAISWDGHNQITNSAGVTIMTNTMNRKSRSIVMTAADHADLESVVMSTGKVSERESADSARWKAS